MANNDGGGEDFSDAANSIMDSFSQLQESMQDYADQLSQMQNDAGDTLFDSDFMQSLEESLFVLSENSPIHIDKQEELIGSIESLERKIEELGKKLESTEVATGGGGSGVSPIDYNRLESSVSEGVSSGLQESEITVSGGRSIASLADRLGKWLEILSGNLSPDERPGGLSGDDLVELAAEGEPGMGMIRDSMSDLFSAFEEEHEVPSESRGGKLSQILGGEGGLPQGFPDFFENINEEQVEGYANDIRASVDLLEKMGVKLEELTEKGTEFKNKTFISLKDVLENDLRKETKSYNNLMVALYAKFNDTIGQESQKLVNKTRKISQTAKKELQDLQFREKGDILGMDPYMEKLDELSSTIEESVLEGILPNVPDIADRLGMEEDKVEEALIGPANRVLKKFQQLDDQDMSVDELRSELSAVGDEVAQDYSKARSESQDLADSQDEIVQNMVNLLSNTKEFQDESEAMAESYDKQLADVRALVKGWENLKETASGYATILTSWRAIGIFGLSALMSAVKSLASYFLSIDQTMQELAENTGLLSRNLREVRQRSMSIHGEMLATGAAFSDIVNAAGVMRSELGGTENAVRRLGYDSAAALQQSIVRTAQGFNVSNSAAAELLNTMNAITGATGKQLEQGMRFVQELSAINEVAPQQIMKDAAEAAGELAKFGGLTADEIATAAVEARKMGSNLSDVLNIAKGFREDITGSVQQLQQAALMAGQRIDTQGLIEASFQSPQKFTNRLRKEIGKLNLNFENLAPYRIQQIAEGFGISARKLREMNRAAKHAKMRFKDLGERGKSAAQRMSAVGNRVKSSQTTWNQLKNTISGLATLLLNTFAGPIFRIVNPVLKSFAEYLGDALEGLGDLSQASFSDVFDAVSKSAKKAVNESEKVKKMTAGFNWEGLVSSFWVVVNVVDKVGTALYEFTEAFLPVIRLINDFADLISSIGLSKGWSTIIAYTTAFLGIKKVISGLGGMLTSFGSEYLDIFGSSGTVAKSTKSVSALKSAGVQLALFAGSIYIASEAIQNFAELTWFEIAKGMVAFSGAAVIMSGALVGMSHLMSGVNWKTMAAASGLILALAGSMWVLGDAIQKFADAGWEGAKIMAAVAGGLVVLGGALALVLSSGVGAAAAKGAAGLFGVFAGSMWILSDAMQGFAGAYQGFAKALHSILDVVNRIQKLENLSSLAPKIMKLTEALSNMPTAGIGDFFAGLVGEGVGDQLGMIVELAHSAGPLQIVAQSMERIAMSFERIAAAEVSEELQKIKDISYNKRKGREALSSQKNQVSSPTVDTVRTGMGYSAGVLGQSNQEDTTTTTTTKGGGKKPDSIREILKDIRNTENALLSSLRKGDIRVYMDGEDVTDTVYKHSTRRNQSG